MSRPFIPVPATVSLELIYTYQTQVIENVLHVAAGLDFDAAAIVALRNCILSWDTANWVYARPAGSVLNRIRIKALHASDAPMEDYSLPSPHAGGLSGVALPGSVTFALKLATAYGGRSARGRVFLPGLSANDITGNTVNSASAAAFVSRLNALRPALLAARSDFVHVVTSYRTGNAWRLMGFNYPVTSVLYTDLNIDNQRRRLTGRGRS